MPSECSELEKKYMLGCYARFPVEFVKGEGSWLEDSEGKRYLDFGTGIAVNSLGHSFEPIVKAIQEQTSRFTHLSNLFYVRSQSLLAQKLLDASAFDKAFFCNSGTEANEAAVKFARLYFARTGNIQKTKVISFNSSFHGRTYASLAMTGQPALREGFGPMPEGFVNIPWNDSKAFLEAFDDDVAAVLMEPIIAEGGILEPSKEFLKTIQETLAVNDCLLIHDEVQTGLGRLGTLFGGEFTGLKPDLVSLAKPLGGGLPLGAVLMKERIAEQVKPSDHGSTFGGNPVACAAGLALVNTILEENFLSDVQSRAEVLKKGFQELSEKYEFLGEVRGRGFLLGIQTSLEVVSVLNQLREKGLIALRAGKDVLRVLPPINVKEQEIEEALTILDETFTQIKQNTGV